MDSTKQVGRHALMVIVASTFCRHSIGSEVTGAGPMELQEALQKVNADLEEANRELHDLREVCSLLVEGQAALQCRWHVQPCLFTQTHVMYSQV